MPEQRLEFTCAVCGFTGPMSDHGAVRVREAQRVAQGLQRGMTVVRVVEDLCSICVARERAA